MSLAKIQELFWRAATTGTADDEELARTFVGTRDLRDSERLAIYSNMYAFRLVDTMREDYPKVATLVDDEPFFKLALSFLRERPSTHPSVEMAGRGFAEFLARQGGLRADLPDLARLEWARSEAFWAADTLALGRDAFVRVGEGLPMARLVISPSVRVIELRHACLPLWAALDRGETPPPPWVADTRVVVWKQDFEVFHAMVTLSESTAIMRALQGATLSAVCEPLEGVDRALKTISEWIGDGWISAVQV